MAQPQQITRADRDKNHAKSELSAKEQRAKAMADEQARLIKVDADAKKHRAEIQKADDDRRKSEEGLAKSLKPESPYQKEVEPRVTTRTTTMMLDAVRACVAKPKQLVHWVSVSDRMARECLARAYPLALQMGHMATMDDKACALNFPNGSRIEFKCPPK